MEITLDNDRLNLLLKGNVRILREIVDYFTEFAPGYRFSPLYLSGRWDGKISVFNRKDSSLPYGLLTDLLLFKRRKYPNDKWIVSDDVKSIFKGKEVPLKWDLKFIPRNYQQECITSALRTKRAIWRCGTGGGKCLFDINLEVEMDPSTYNTYFNDYEKLD